MTDGSGERGKSLSDRVQEIESWREYWVDPKLKKLETTSDALVAFQRWVMAGALTTAAIFGFFADAVKKKLGIS